MLIIASVCMLSVIAHMLIGWAKRNPKFAEDDFRDL